MATENQTKVAGATTEATGADVVTRFAPKDTPESIAGDVEKVL